MENPEAFLQELEEFNRNDVDTEKPLPEVFENYIEFVSKTGSCLYPWNKIKKLYVAKLNNILDNLKNLFVSMSSSVDNFNSSSYSANADNKPNENEIQVLRERIIDRMQSFSSAPFTIQRISELMLKPNSHYNRADKFLRGLEKCVMVVTTVDPYGNKIFVENYQANGVSRSPSPSITPKRPATPIQDENKAEEMLVQDAPQFVNDQTIPVVDSLTTTTIVKSIVVSNAEDSQHGVAIHVDETEVMKTTTSVVLDAGKMTVETSEVIKETHIEVDQESKSHANGVEMRESDEPISEMTETKGEKHAHSNEAEIEDEMEIEKKKIKLNSSASEEGLIVEAENKKENGENNHIEQTESS